MNQIKRLVMDIDINLHAEIKMRAARQEIPMTLWVRSAVLRAIKEEDKYYRPLILTKDGSDLG